MGEPGTRPGGTQRPRGRYQRRVGLSSGTQAASREAWGTGNPPGTDHVVHPPISRSQDRGGGRPPRTVRRTTHRDGHPPSRWSGRGSPGDSALGWGSLGARGFVAGSVERRGQRPVPRVCLGSNLASRADGASQDGNIVSEARTGTGVPHSRSVAGSGAPPGWRTAAPSRERTARGRTPRGSVA
jgi:hypothetical protein